MSFRSWMDVCQCRNACIQNGIYRVPLWTHLWAPSDNKIVRDQVLFIRALRWFSFMLLFNGSMLAVLFTDQFSGPGTAIGPVCLPHNNFGLNALWPRYLARWNIAQRFGFVSRFWRFTITRKPPVEAALVVTYLQFPIQVCCPCSARQSLTDTAAVTDTCGVNSSIDYVYVCICVCMYLGLI